MRELMWRIPIEWRSSTGLCRCGPGVSIFSPKRCARSGFSSWSCRLYYVWLLRWKYLDHHWFSSKSQTRCSFTSSILPCFTMSGHCSYFIAKTTTISIRIRISLQDSSSGPFGYCVSTHCSCRSFNFLSAIQRSTISKGSCYCDFTVSQSYTACVSAVN